MLNKQHVLYSTSSMCFLLLTLTSLCKMLGPIIMARLLSVIRFPVSYSVCVVCERLIGMSTYYYYRLRAT